MSTSLTRRQVAKGAAWAAPVIAATAAVPAYASSNTCRLDVLAAGATFFDYGERNIDQATNLTDGYVEVDDGRVRIIGLNDGETVTSISYSIQVENANASRTAGNNQGFDDPNTSTIEINDAGLGDGWQLDGGDPTQPTTTTLQDGSTREYDMWTIWFSNTSNPGTYSTDANGCNVFDSTNVVTGDGGFSIHYPNFVAYEGEAQRIVVNQVMRFSITTSQNRRITYYGYLFDNSTTKGTVTNTMTVM